jgi:hypothetical protein
MCIYASIFFFFFLIAFLPCRLLDESDQFVLTHKNIDAVAEKETILTELILFHDEV